MTGPSEPEIEQPTTQPGCWWHPDRATGLSCARCGRPACPDCLREAAVGFHCVDCVQAGRQQQKRQQKQHQTLDLGERTVAGAKLARRPIITPILIVINVLVYVYTAVQAQSFNNEGSSSLRNGVLFPLSVGVDGEWWRLFTSGFLHYGLIHIAVNMFSLWVLGRDLELLLGKLRFAAVYFLALFGGSVAVYLFDSIGVQAAGASGAIYGLLGGLLIAVLRLKLNPSYAIGVIVLNIVISVSIPNISLIDHLGGLVVGAALTAAMVYAPSVKREFWQGAAVVVVLVILIGLTISRSSDLAELVCVVRDQQLFCGKPSVALG